MNTGNHNCCPFERILFLFTATILFPLGMCAQETFVVSDIYSIRPDGSPQELRSQDWGELTVRNNHWDKASRTAILYAARDEEVALQIVIPDAGRSYSAKAGNLKGAATIPAERVSFSLVAWVRHQTLGLCPDLVIPLDGSVAGVKSFDIPLQIEGIPQPDNRYGILLCEVWVPPDAAAGKYQGIISIDRGDEHYDSINLELNVFDFTLPRQPSLAFELLSYGMQSVAFGKAAYLNPKPGLGQAAEFVPDSAKAVDYRVYALAFANRCFLNAIPYHSQRGRPRYALPVSGSGDDAKITGFAEWDDFFAPLLDGALNKFGVAPAHFMLPFNINYPYTGEDDPAKQFDLIPYHTSIPDGPGIEPALKIFESSYMAIARQYIRHLSEHGWADTRFEIYNNQKPNPQRNRTPWKLDEPTGAEDYRGLQYLFNLSRRAFAEAGDSGVRISNRLDIGHFNCDRFRSADGQAARCYKAKAFNSADADALLKNRVDHWVIGSDHIEAAVHTLPEYRSEGVKLINYSTAGTADIDGNFNLFAGEGWRAAALGIDGRVIYKTGLDDGDPNHIEEGSRNSQTMYSAMTLGYRGPLASRRLKLWRNAVNDFDYIKLAGQADAARTRALVGQMVHDGPAHDAKYRSRSRAKGFWINNNVEDMLRSRLILAGIITGTAYGGMPLQGPDNGYLPCGKQERIEGYD